MRVWSPDEWQEHVTMLVKRHYGPGEYVEVPDRDRGDCGLEGYSRSGHLYQCYVAEEPCTLDELTQKQKRKITDDLRKFVNNKAKLVKILGTVKITRWILMVPHYDSKALIEHTTKKTEDVRQEKLPYVDNDFFVHLETEAAFEVERQQLLGVGLAKTNIVVPAVQAEEIAGWAGQNPDQLQTLSNKVERIPNLTSSQSRAEFRDRIIKVYLEGQNALALLNEYYPEQYEQVRFAKNRREEFLEMECMLATGPPSQLLMSTLQDFERHLLTNIVGISESTARRLTWEAVSDWLIRCPIRFPEIPING